MKSNVSVWILISMASVVVSSCTALTGVGGASALLVAAKAVEVADAVGGSNGFGGMIMNGYTDHVEPQMGFLDENDLADADTHMTIRLRNDTGESCTFHLSYFASHMGLDE